MKLKIPLEQEETAYLNIHNQCILCLKFVDKFFGRNDVLHVLLTISDEEFDSSTEFRYVPSNAISNSCVNIFTPTGPREHEIFHALNDILRENFNLDPDLSLYFTLTPVHAMNELETQTEN